MKRAFLLLMVLATTSVTLPVGAAPGPHGDAPAATYDTRGVIKSFGPGRTFVDIAHEAIPGFMGAMTMTFEPRAPAQVDGLAEGDRVAFTFSIGDDHHLRLDSIRKQ